MGASSVVKPFCASVSNACSSFPHPHQVDWIKVNAALGYFALLLAAVCTQTGCKFSEYGSGSRDCGYPFTRAAPCSAITRVMLAHPPPPAGFASFLKAAFQKSQRLEMNAKRMSCT